MKIIINGVTHEAAAVEIEMTDDSDEVRVTGMSFDYYTWRSMAFRKDVLSLSESIEPPGCGPDLRDAKIAFSDMGHSTIGTSFIDVGPYSDSFTFVAKDSA